MKEQKYATIDEVIEMLKKVSKDGYGDYTLSCNEEYYFAVAGEEPEFNHKHKNVDFGGYC